MRQAPTKAHAASIPSGEAPNLSLWAFPRKKIAAKSRITIPDHHYLKTSHSRKNSSALLRLIHHKYRHAAVAVDCRSASLSGPTVRRNAVSRSHGPAMRRSRGLRCCGSTGLGDHALAGLLFDLGREEWALWRPRCQLPLRAPRGRWGRFSLRGGFSGAGPPQALQLRHRPWCSFAQSGRSVAEAFFSPLLLT